MEESYYSTFFALTVILPWVTGQQIIDFKKAKSLRRDSEKGIFYALFKSHQNRRLDNSPLVTSFYKVDGHALNSVLKIQNVFPSI